MCISLLSRRRISATLIEQIWLEVSPNGEIGVKEAYDVFLTFPSRALSDCQPSNSGQLRGCCRLLVLYPHCLLDSQRELTVRFEERPGAHTSRFDAVYGANCSYDVPKNVFAIRIPHSTEGIDAEYQKWAGEVCVPGAHIPRSIASNENACHLTNRGKVGTILELHFKGVVADKPYAFRLTTELAELNDDLIRVNLPEPDGSEGLEWKRPLDILAPNSLYRNTRELLRLLEAESDQRDASIAMRRAIEATDHDGTAYRPVMFDVHRLFLLYGSDVTTIDKSESGSMVYTGPVQVEVPSTRERINGVGWAGGVNRYWSDDPYEVMKRIMVWMRAWGSDPKTKAEITIGLESRASANIGLLVDQLALQKYGLLQAVGEGRYRCGERCPDTALLIDAGACDLQFEEISASSEVFEHFVPVDFEIRYTAHYRYASAATAKRVRARALRETFVFWGTIVSIFLGIAAFVLAVFSLYHR